MYTIVIAKNAFLLSALRFASSVRLDDFFGDVWLFTNQVTNSDFTRRLISAIQSSWKWFDRQAAIDIVINNLANSIDDED